MDIRIEEKPAFSVVGRKIFIDGQGNEQFGAFWKESHENGLIDRLRKVNNNKPGNVTGSFVLGVSCVERDPLNRSFDFYIAAEADDKDIDGTLEYYTVPACKWAIFSNRGELPKALVDAEMHAFMEWMSSSSYKHDNAPELEVYPAQDDKLVEFWLPVREIRGC